MATTPKIVFQGPMNLKDYNSSIPASAQASKFPATFIACMTVREEVFGQEQGVPLVLEADAADFRCCHWAVYDVLPGSEEPQPVATIRLVPYPHDPHPLPGSALEDPEDPVAPDLNAGPPPWIVDRATSMHDGREPYIKLGRMAVVKGARGRGIADLLVKTALKWAQENPTFFEGSADPDGSHPPWNGLVCAHAQTYVVKFWAKFGFRVDEGMGTWTEAAIPHVGMFQRLELNENN